MEQEKNSEYTEKDLQNLMRGDEDKAAKNRMSIILLVIVGVIIIAVLAVSVVTSYNQPVTPEKLQMNREDFAKSYDLELAKETKTTFRPSSFEEDTFVIGVEIKKAAFTLGKVVVDPAWLKKTDQEGLAKALCKESSRIIKNRYIGVKAVEYRYFYDNTMQYGFRFTLENCDEYL